MARFVQCWAALARSFLTRPVNRAKLRAPRLISKSCSCCWLLVVQLFLRPKPFAAMAAALPVVAAAPSSVPPAVATETKSAQKKPAAPAAGQKRAVIALDSYPISESKSLTGLYQFFKSQRVVPEDGPAGQAPLEGDHAKAMAVSPPVRRLCARAISFAALLLRRFACPSSCGSSGRGMRLPSTSFRSSATSTS